ncbi:MAG: T9SS type A sorting domain-containing protein [candidate division WOR-3 bacterium]
MITLQALPANHYIRAGATGANNGNNWVDAWTRLPDVLVRGDTYYVASGTYPFYRIEEVNGSGYIVIKKATEFDHGTDSGWVSAYGQGVASFQGLEILASCVILDGQTGGGPGNWNSGFGFEVVRTPPDNCGDNGDLLRIGASINDPKTNIYISHVKFYSTSTNYPMGGISLYGGVANATISYCSITNIFGCPFFFNSCSNVIIEYNYIANTRSTGSVDPYCPGWHTEGISSIGQNTNITIRYNLWDRIAGTAIIAGINNGTCENWKIYGNIFARSVTTIRYYYDGTSNRQVMNNLEFYNNDIVGIPETIGGYGVSQGGIVIDSGNNNKVYNNIWYNNIANSFSIDAEHGFNYFAENRRVEGCYPQPCDMDEDAAVDDVNTQLGPDASPFISGDGAGDPLQASFLLKVPTEPGLPLSAEFNKDMFGNIRGEDGVWDRGACEYVNSSDVCDEISELADFILSQNCPNPFNPKTIINYSIGTRGYVSLKIYDILGREIAILVDGIKEAGYHKVEWNGKSSSGQQVVSGVYLYQLKTSSGFVSTKKMLVIR